MEFWEFLIQQEGDRSWLPLESPSVEILEGRYRIVARSSRKQTATEVRVTHYATDATPPVRRVRKRSGQTNPEGLIVILPFTRLQPGLWELRCTGDLLSEMMGETWQYAVRLEVLPVVTEWDQDWQDSPPESITQTQGELAVAFATSAAVTETPATETPATEITSPVIAETALSPAVSAPDRADDDTAQPQEGLDQPQDSEPFEPVTAAEASQEPISQDVDQVEPAQSATAFEWQDAPAQTTASQSYLDELPSEWQDGSPAEADLLDADLLDADDPSHASAALQVFLDREVFVIQRGETLALTGRIEFAPEASSTWQPAISELGVRLYDPQTSQLLMDEVYPIDHRVPPFPFSGTVSLPDHYQTYLVLGELVFRGATPAGELQVLATRSFNVTTDLHELIESIANDFLEGDSLPPEAQMPEAEPVPLAELNQLPSFRRSPQQPLPPQLRPHNPARTHASLILPSFGSVTAPATPISTSAADLLGLQTVGNGATAPGPTETGPTAGRAETGSIETGPTGASHGNPETLDESATVPETPGSITPAGEAQPALAANLTEIQPTKIQPTETQPDQPLAEGLEVNLDQAEASSGSLDPEADSDLFFEWADSESPLPAWQRPVTPPAPLSNKPEDISFRALNFQSRFWNRLQDLASRPELSAAIAAEEAQIAAQTGVPTDLQTTQRPPSSLDADLAAQEFVVEDGRTGIGLPFGVGHPTETHSTSGLPAMSQADLLNEMVLPADEPIPTPRLQLPTGELIAEQPIAITVKLPNLEARVYVKLWLRDRQTRTLLGTPRWLIDFVPDGFGNQMARTEVIVPPGSLKVQFEAIAVEIATQRESDKVSTTRPIVPPDLSPLSLDRLEI
jgi:hypothetical protein